MATTLLAIWMFLGLVQVCECLQWSSSATLQDKVTIPACAGQDVTLAWDYTHTAEEHVMDVEWRYRANSGSTDVVLATEINGHFFTEQSTDKRIEYIPGAGIRLLGVKAEDSGTYSVRVNLNIQGSVQAHVQSATVVVTDSPITVGGTNLQAHLQGATFLNTTQQHHLILVCGNFDPLWTPRVSVIWTTPENKTVPSTYEQNGRFALAVPNLFISGEYTCKIDNSSPATLCIPSDSPLRRGATVLVDGVEGRIALMDSEMKAWQKEVQLLKTEKDQMMGEIQTLMNERNRMTNEINSLQAENNRLAAEIQNVPNHDLRHKHGIRLVGGSNAREGRVEIFVNGNWSTVCGTNWTVLEARVACRQLAYSTTRSTAYTSASHFGEGTGVVTNVYSCLGLENYLLDCQYVQIPARGCNHTMDVGVRCA